jgi:hypothetical protein
MVVCFLLLIVDVLLARPCYLPNPARIGRSQEDMTMTTVAGWFQNAIETA